MPLDDLSSDPIVPAPVPEAVREYLEYLDSLIDDDDVMGYAVDTLRGIRRTVVEYNRVTENQRRAVQNIVSGAAEGQRTRERHRSGTSRRYEGFGRR